MLGLKNAVQKTIENPKAYIENFFKKMMNKGLLEDKFYPYNDERDFKYFIELAETEDVDIIISGESNGDTVYVKIKEKLIEEWESPNRAGKAKFCHWY